MDGTEAGQVRNDNGVEMKLVWCPAGEFTMGSPKSEKRSDADEDQVNVKLKKGFWLGKYEVTQGEWEEVMKTTPWKGKEYAKEGAKYPAMYVSWQDAVAFCEKLTKQERTGGRLTDGWLYTLPTEAQWEYACRAGTNTPYSFGDNESALSEYAWWGGLFGDGNAKSEQYAHPVGTKKPNARGLYDMHGNVYEWCRDVYAEKLPGGTAPEVTSGSPDRVARGGGWCDRAESCRSAYRYGGTSGYRDFALGFRVACNSGQ